MADLSFDLAADLAIDFAEPTPASILGSLLVEYWDARYGVTLVSGAVDTWTGLFGRVLSAAGVGNRPLFSVDGSNFLGRPVVQSSTTGPRWLQNLAATPTWLNGSSPYMLGVLRVRAHSASNRWAFRNLNTAESQGGPDLLFQANGATFTNALGASVAFGASTTEHVLESWLVAGTSTAVSVDGADTVQGSAGTISGDRTKLTAGAANGSGGGALDVSEAAYVLCSAVPSSTQRAALQAWARSVWGAP